MPKQLQTSHANLFIPVEKLPWTYFPSFLLRIPEIKYAKTLAMSQFASFETALLHNTITVVSLLSFFQMLTSTPRVKSSQFY